MCRRGHPTDSTQPPSQLMQKSLGLGAGTPIVSKAIGAKWQSRWQYLLVLRTSTAAATSPAPCVVKCMQVYMMGQMYHRANVSGQVTSQISITSHSDPGHKRSTIRTFAKCMHCEITCQRAPTKKGCEQLIVFLKFFLINYVN